MAMLQIEWTNFAAHSLFISNYEWDCIIGLNISKALDYWHPVRINYYFILWYLQILHSFQVLVVKNKIWTVICLGYKENNYILESKMGSERNTTTQEITHKHMQMIQLKLSVSFKHFIIPLHIGQPISKVYRIHINK